MGSVTYAVHGFKTLRSQVCILEKGSRCGNGGSIIMKWYWFCRYSEICWGSHFEKHCSKSLRTSPTLISFIILASYFWKVPQFLHFLIPHLGFFVLIIAILHIKISPHFHRNTKPWKGFHSQVKWHFFTLHIFIVYDEDETEQYVWNLFSNSSLDCFK